MPLSLSSFLSTDYLVLLVTILVPFGGAMVWIGIVNEKLNSLKDDVKDLKRITLNSNHT
jgi:hypothetical protein